MISRMWHGWTKPEHADEVRRLAAERFRDADATGA
jgi:hypothetical protein